MMSVSLSCRAASARWLRVPYAVRCASYFSAPKPSLTIEDVEKLARTQKAKNTVAGYSNKHRLSEPERTVMGAGRRSGFIQLANHCGVGLTNTYFKYCCNSKRPYVAIHRDGRQMEVDLACSLGLGKNRDIAYLDKLTDAIKSIIASDKRGGIQIVNSETLKTQRDKIVQGATEGSNSMKIADVEPNDAFTLYTLDRDQSVAIANSIYAAHRQLSSLPTLEKLAEESEERKAARAEAHNQRMIRRLEKLAADPRAMKHLRVRAGAMDGFIRAQAAGHLNLA